MTYMGTRKQQESESGESGDTILISCGK